MSRVRLSATFSRYLAVTVLGFSLTAAAVGQAPPPVTPNPLAPTLAVPFPLGVQRGVPLELSLTGTNLAGPTGLWTTIPGAKAVIPTDMNNGKDNAKLRVRLEVPKDAPLGLYPMRLATTRGLSNIRLFCVDDLPQVIEVDTNRTKATPQAVPVPCVVIGRADNEINDYYKITVKAGQRLTFEILGHRLGSPIDPQLTLFDARTLRELPGGHSNDAPGLQTDPRLTYVFKDPGDYLVEVRDVTYRGGPDFVYRLRIGDFPCATTPLPLAVKRGSKTSVRFAGPMVEGVPPVEVAAPTDPAVEAIWVTPRGANGLHGWPVSLALSDLNETTEQEPNNEPAKANRLTVPAGASGRIQERGDVDHYVFAAKKGQRLIFEAQSHELNSPTELFLTLKDAKGNQLAATNPAADPRLDYTAPADGDYILAVDQLLGVSGPDESYRVTVKPYEPGFDLSFGIDRYDIPQGAGAALNLMAVRRDYAGPIEVSVIGHPGFSGTATIDAGQPAAPTLPAAVFILSAKPDVPLGAYVVQVQGKAVVNGKPIVHNATLKAVVSQNLGGLAYPPLQLEHQLGLAVTPKPPFTLAAALDTPDAVRGVAANLTVTATRSPGFTDEITLAPLNLPANVAPAAKNIPKGQNSVKIQLTPAANAALGKFLVGVTGKAKFQNVDYSVAGQLVPLSVALPFDLKVAPAPVKLAQGGKSKVKITAARKGGYQGPIAVELRNLPAGVTAPKATIPMGKSEVEIELSATAAAAPSNKADVNVLGTATAAANQQNASPNFAVTVAKK